MLNLAYISLLVFALSGFVGCKPGGTGSSSKAEENTGGANDENGPSLGYYTKQYLGGNWVKHDGCVAAEADLDGDGDSDFTKNTYTFTGDSAGGEWENRLTYYDDSSCTTALYTQRSTGIYTFGAESPTIGGAVEIDFENTNLYIKPETAQMVSNLNTISYCGKSDWAVGVDSNASGQGGCSLSSIVYTLVKIPPFDTNQLFWGDPATGIGSSDGNRPTDVLPTASFQK